MTLIEIIKESLIYVFFFGMLIGMVEEWRNGGKKQKKQDKPEVVRETRTKRTEEEIRAEVRADLEKGNSLFDAAVERVFKGSGKEAGK